MTDSGLGVPDNSGGPVQGTVDVYAANLGGGTGGADLYSSDSRAWFIPAYSQSMSYDADGNLHYDGLWTYTYDAENRLVRAVSDSGVNSGFTHRQLDFKYDYMGRRVEKTVTNLDTSSAATRRFVYDGWNLIAELDGSATSLLRSYVWGLDMTGSLTATGGTGALLRVTNYTSGSPGTNYYAATDASGNTTALVNASTGAVAALYEYDPFGNSLRTEVNDSAVADNPFRFATKYADLETGLVYYGLRYYDPVMGRFINKDPIAEQGGLNLYGFCGNDAINGWDYLGLVRTNCVVWRWTASVDGKVVDVSYDIRCDDVDTSAWRNGDHNARNNNGGRTSPAPQPSDNTQPGQKPIVPNMTLSKKECDDLAAKIGNNQKTLAGMVDTVSRESIADRIMGTVMKGLDQSMPYSDMAENFAEGTYRLGKAGLDAVGARGARKALTSVYSGGGAKVINAVGVVNNLWDAAQVGRAIYNRDGLGFIQSSAGLASDFVTAVPAFKMAISGFKFVWDGESQRAQNDIETADLASIAANGQAANLNAMIGLKNIAQWKKEFVDGGCK